MNVFSLFRNTSLPCLATLLLPLMLGCMAQAQPEKTAISQQALKTLTDSLSSQLSKYYVDKDAAAKMGAAVKKNFRDGKYRGIRDVHVLAGRLTEDLQSVHRDEHLHVEYNPEIAYELSGDVEDVPAMVARKHERERQQNFGFKKAEVLSGNIGYLELSRFSRLNGYSKATADAALAMLSNAGAIIIDLRYGAGGSPEMLTHILSHFYKEKIHVSDIYIRNENTTLSYFTTPDPAYGRLTEVPLYVLTSYKTFSAAEGLVYTLKNTGRARVIGEITRGGAHTVTYRPLSGGFICDIPFGKAFDPATGQNWEATGIKPDVEVPAEQALVAAQHLIFESAIRSSTDSVEKKWLGWHYELLKTKSLHTEVDSMTLKTFAGNYGPFCVTFRNGCLYYQKTGKASFPLIPVTRNSMRVKGDDTFLVRFDTTASGDAVKLSTLYDDGRIEQADRSE